MKHFLIISGAVVIGLMISYLISSPTSNQSSQSAGSIVEENAENSSQNATTSIASETTATAALEIESPLITAAAENAKVFFVQPSNGDVVSSPVKIIFGAENMTVVNAGDQTEYSGHHHLLINYDGLPDMSLPLPANDNLIHFGGGQTETELELPAGKHTLQLLLGNWAHVPHKDPVMSEKITITVQ